LAAGIAAEVDCNILLVAVFVLAWTFDFGTGAVLASTFFAGAAIVLPLATAFLPLATSFFYGALDVARGLAAVLTTLALSLVQPLLSLPFCFWHFFGSTAFLLRLFTLANHFSVFLAALLPSHRILLSI
jgi:hypothetical protein